MVNLNTPLNIKTSSLFKKKKKKEEEKTTITELPPKPLPQRETPVPAKAPELNPNIPKILRNEETGKISGLAIGDKTFMGINKKDIASIIGKQAPEPTPAGAMELTEALRLNQEAAQLQEQQRIGMELAGGVNQLNPEILAQMQKSGIDIKQVIGGGLGSAVPGVAGGAVTGAIAGAPFAGIGAIPGAIGGAIAGGIGAFLVGARSNLKSQRTGDIQAGGASLMDGEKNLRKFITAANKDPSNAVQYQSDFREQLSYIERDYGSLQLDTKGFLKDLSGADGTPQLADFQRFYDTTRPFLISQMQMALINPDPNKTLLTMEEMSS